MPVDWIDGVHPVNAQNLGVMEDDIAAVAQDVTEKQSLSEKAQANGYASLDGTGKVPLAQLPPVGADLVYNGDYAAGPTYEDGDIVVSNGIAYMCVVPTTTPPEVWPGGPTPAPPMPAIPYGTTLPASPTDGMEAILVDSVSNPSYQWRFRYNAQSSSAYKWEFVGGAARYIESTTDDAAIGGAIANLPGGPTFVLPRAGDWQLTIDGLANNSVGDAQIFLSVGDAAIAASSVITRGWGQVTVAGRWAPAHAEGRASGLASGITLATKAWHTGGGTATWTNRRLLVLPVRVS